jgi:RND family efflux transporter MFP subunit
MRRVLIHWILPLVIFLSAGGAAWILIQSSKPAERSEPKQVTPLVEVARVSASNQPARVEATAVIEPARQVTISPEVSGKIVYQSPQLVPGGRFKQGDVLVRIDPRPYKLAIRERRSQVQQGRLELTVEKGRGEIAEREWKLIEGDSKDDSEPNPLALREPQREAAEVSLEAAQAALERAELDLSRTTIRAPFNATVTSESVDIGQVVQPGQAIATLIGTDQFWAVVSLPVEQLALLEIPGFNAPPQRASSARVTQALGTETHVERKGQLLRLVGELDRETRRAQVSVGIDDPLDPGSGELPLLPGAFATVEMEGRELQGTILVPRRAVFDGRRVWVVDEQDRLSKRELTIVWESPDWVFARAGIAEGDRVALDQLPFAADGMAVRVRLTDETGRAVEPAKAGAANDTDSES